MMGNAFVALLAVSLTIQAGAVFAQAADNSKSNSAPANSSDSSSIADGQKNNRLDLKLTATIRQSVMADKTLSVDAHNVKIVTVNGYVTLNGVVRSDSEKLAVEAKAVNVAGADKVRNDLQVAPQS
jgi:hyperosmotically inducible periplasmic protein